jgi:addiction module HigA family antidote
MKIKNVIHKGLRRLIEENDASGVHPACVEKLRRMVTFLQDMGHEDELRSVPSWKAHVLTGEYKGSWSLFVTRNWRLTFRIERDTVEIADLDFKDYHEDHAMSTPNGIRMKSPAHPGGFIKCDIVEPLGLSVTGAARVLGVTRPALSALLNQRAHLSSDMALRIEKAFGVRMDTLMRMQNSFDIAEARKREGEIDVAPYAGHLSEPPQGAG